MLWVCMLCPILVPSELPAFTEVSQLPPVSAVTPIPAVTPQMCTARVLCSGNQIQFPAQSPPPFGSLKDWVLDKYRDEIGMDPALQVLVSVVFSSCRQNVNWAFSSALVVFVSRGKGRGRDLHASEKGVGIYSVSTVELFLMCQSFISIFLLHIPSSCNQK